VREKNLILDFFIILNNFNIFVADQERKKSREQNKLVMRARYIYWTFIILLTVSSGVFAQKSATAVMNVSVNVISGSTITDVHEMEIDFDSKEINTGGFALTTPKEVETLINSEPHITLTNQFGETITLESDNSVSENEELQSVNLGAILADSDSNLRGQYQGNLTTTIAYF
jgi:hypothetical protein